MEMSARKSMHAYTCMYMCIGKCVRAGVAYGGGYRCVLVFMCMYVRIRKRVRVRVFVCEGNAGVCGWVEGSVCVCM